jgi:lipoate-protein ligase A
MRLLRGRARTPERDRRATAATLSRAAETGVPALRVWSPHRQVAFGRRDAREPGYDAARAAAEERGFAAVERRVGGRAAAYSGRTVAFARAEPIEDVRVGLDARYADATGRVRSALTRLGVDARPGEPADSFCPGAHSLRAGGKVAGLAQRVTADAALIAGVVIVADREALCDVLAPVYGALGVRFDRDSLGSVAAAGGPAEAAAVREALEAAFAGGDAATVERVDEGDASLDGDECDVAADDVA